MCLRSWNLMSDNPSLVRSGFECLWWKLSASVGLPRAFGNARPSSVQEPFEAAYPFVSSRSSVLRAISRTSISSSVSRQTLNRNPVVLIGVDRGGAGSDDGARRRLPRESREGALREPSARSGLSEVWAAIRPFFLEMPQLPQ